MATVVNQSYQAAPQQGSSDQLTALLFQAAMRKREHDREQQAQQQALQEQMAASQTSANLIGQAMEPGRTSIGGQEASDLLQQMIRAGTRPNQALQGVLDLQGMVSQREQERQTQEAFAELGSGFLGSRNPRQQFAGEILSNPNIPPAQKTSILSQTGVLFPEPKGAGEGLVDVKIYTADGAERAIRVPKSVQDPQAYIEENMPALISAGFSTTKPADGGDPSETERNVRSIIETTPELQAIEPGRAEPIARQILLNEEDIRREVENSYATEADQGVAMFPDETSTIKARLAVGNVRTIMTEGVTDPGQVQSEARTRAEQQFNNLDWLPEDVAITPALAGQPTDAKIEHLGRTVEFLTDPDKQYVPGITQEETVDNALRLIENRARLPAQIREQLRNNALGIVPEDESAEPEPSALQRFFGGF